MSDRHFQFPVVIIVTWLITQKELSLDTKGMNSLAWLKLWLWFDKGFRMYIANMRMAMVKVGHSFHGEALDWCTTKRMKDTVNWLCINKSNGQEIQQAVNWLHRWSYQVMALDLVDGRWIESTVAWLERDTRLVVVVSQRSCRLSIISESYLELCSLMSFAKCSIMNWLFGDLMKTTGITFGCLER